jgi:hypothetical protein
MTRIWAAFLLGFFLLIASACTGGDLNAVATGGTTQPQAELAQVSSETGTFFAINEIGLGQNGYVALTNFTDVPASLAGLYLCQGVGCFELPDVVVGAGATVRIATGEGAGLEDVVATYATLGELRPSDGEIALATSAKPDDPQSLLLYFQWGSNPHELTQNAVKAGLWVKGGYGPSSQNATRLFKDAKTGLWLFDEP